jgi:glycosyltransferase involved in cell wall biosynthesis
VAYRIGIDARRLTDESGMDSYVRNLTRALSAIDKVNEYHLFVNSWDDSLLDQLQDNFQAVVEPCPVFSVREQVSLSWRLLRCKLDLYHATHYLLPAIVPCRSVITVYDILDVFYPHFRPSPLAFFYAQRQIRRSLARSDRIIADSRNTKTDLMDRLGIDGRRIRVVYPGVPAAFNSRVADDEVDGILARLGIERPYLLLVDDRPERSNLDRVVQAFAAALERRPFAAALVCVGPRTSLDFKVRQRAERLGLADRLVLLGSLSADDQPAVYRSAELFLYPTLEDASGLTVADALASEVPVIASATAALREVAEGYAVLVDPLDRKQLANAIIGLMEDDERRAELSRLGAKRAADFAWRGAAEKTLEVYESALRQRSWRPGLRRGSPK